MENSLAITPPEERSPNWRAAGAGLALLLLLALASWMIASQVTGNLAQDRRAKAIAAFEEETGIRILRLAVTAGGGIIDLQYQVVDPDKALIIHDDEKPPMILDEKTNLIFAIQFHEHADRELHTAVTYHNMIMNGGGLLERGGMVSLRVGDSILEHLVVQ
jgi:hypothetical protein